MAVADTAECMLGKRKLTNVTLCANRQHSRNIPDFDLQDKPPHHTQYQRAYSRWRSMRKVIWQTKSSTLRCQSMAKLKVGC